MKNGSNPLTMSNFRFNFDNFMNMDTLGGTAQIKFNLGPFQDNVKEARLMGNGLDKSKIRGEAGQVFPQNLKRKPQKRNPAPITPSRSWRRRVLKGGF